MSKIGFIGIGNMGYPMALNLLRAGFDVVAFDTESKQLERFVREGGKTSTSASKAVLGAEYVITMLPADHIVEAIYFDSDFLNKLSKTALIIDSSTISPSLVKRVQKKLIDHDLAFIDAPVSGGVSGAKAASLTFICGGKSEDIDKAKPILETMGNKIFHAGQIGAGQVAKICNNGLLAIQMIATAEAIQLGNDNGLDPKVLSSIMQESSGNNWCLEKYNPCPGVMEEVPAANNYQGGFMVKLMNKDLTLAKDAATQSHSYTPMADLARQIYQQHGEQSEHLDFSSIQMLFKG